MRSRISRAARSVNVIATTALANFRDDEVDVAIRFGTGPWPPYACEQFLEDEYFPVASRSLLRGRKPRSPRELLGLRFILEERDLWSEWFQAAGVATRPRGVRISRPSWMRNGS